MPLGFGKQFRKKMDEQFYGPPEREPQEPNMPSEAVWTPEGFVARPVECYSQTGRPMYHFAMGPDGNAVAVPHTQAVASPNSVGQLGQFGGVPVVEGTLCQMADGKLRIFLNGQWSPIQADSVDRVWKEAQEKDRKLRTMTTMTPEQTTAVVERLKKEIDQEVALAMTEKLRVFALFPTKKVPMTLEKVIGEATRVYTLTGAPETGYVEFVAIEDEDGHRLAEIGLDRKVAVTMGDTMNVELSDMEFYQALKVDEKKEPVEKFHFKSF